MTKQEAKAYEAAIHAEEPGWTTEVFHDPEGGKTNGWRVYAEHPVYGVVVHRRAMAGMPESPQCLTPKPQS